MLPVSLLCNRLKAVGFNLIRKNTFAAAKEKAKAPAAAKAKTVAAQVKETPAVAAPVVKRPPPPPSRKVDLLALEKPQQFLHFLKYRGRRVSVFCGLLVCLLCDFCNFQINQRLIGQ